MDIATSSCCTVSEQNVIELGHLTQVFAENACTKLHENPVKVLHTDTAGRGTGWSAVTVTLHKFKLDTDVCFKL
jgi:hypothetical protein